MSSKSKSRVSVFDRLGPGNDEQPITGTGRRFSEKHQTPADKPSRHSYPLSSPEPVVPRERKPSDYDDNKHLHYREGASRPRPPHSSIEHSQDSEEEDRYQQRKQQSRGHKSSSSKPVRGAKHKAPSDESQGSGSEGENEKDGSKRRKRDSDSSVRRSKHGEGESKRRHHDRKDKPEHSSSTTTTPSDIKSRSRGKDIPTPHESAGHKRRKEDEYSEPRYTDRKRKHEDDHSSYEHKKPRLSDSAHQSPHREPRPRAEAESRALPDHRRRRDLSPRDRKHPRSHTPETGPSKKLPERSSPLGVKRVEKKVSSHEKKTSSSMDVEEEAAAPEVTKALDWDYLSSYTKRQTAKLDSSKPRSALERFTPGALFAQVGVSPSLAGPNYYTTITALASAHLQQRSEEVAGDPFGEAEFAAVGLAHIRKQREWRTVFRTGEGRRALTASDDYSIRRKLRKQNQSDFLPRIDTPPLWESQHYSTGVALYQSLGKKSSGKPAYRIQESRVGELLVAR